MHPVGGVPTVEEARRRVLAMRSGETFMYWRGYLLNERSSPSVDRLATYMLHAGLPSNYRYAVGARPLQGAALGHLTQQKKGPLDYCYLFTRA